MPATEDQLRQVERLAVGLVHLQLGNAHLDWPTTSRAHPSFWVVMTLTPGGLLWNAAAKEFPMSIRWDFWEGVVVPVLQDDTNQYTPDNGAGVNYGLVSLLNAGSYEDMVRFFASKLVDQMKSVGLLPADPVADVQEAPVVPQAVVNPEEVQQQAELEAAGGTVFLKFDALLEPPVFTKFDE